MSCHIQAVGQAKAQQLSENSRKEKQLGGGDQPKVDFAQVLSTQLNKKAQGDNQRVDLASMLKKAERLG